MRKLRVGVLFGGRSGEHEVSLMSAKSVMKFLDKNRYEVIPLGISREGHWLASGDPLRELEAMAKQVGCLPRETVLSVSPEAMIDHSWVSGAVKTGMPPVDVIFPVLHGPYGEDGTVQGLLELAQIPYVGSGVLGSALGMDKAAAKAIFRAEGLPCADHMLVMRWEWEVHPTAVIARLEQGIGYPCFVKPANLGSSVGVSKVRQPADLPAALDLAGRYDRKLLVENAINARELECGVLGNDQPIASIVGEVIPRREFYDYVAKYLDDGTQLVVPADVPAKKAAEVQELAVRAFMALDCAGMARADFFLCRDSGQVYVNELNTIPGFTSVSMYPKLWEASGLPYPQLLDRLIELALERYGDRGRTSTSYHTDEP